MPEFSVVGGGVAGLVIARRLAASGRTVTLYEATDRLGGAVAQHSVAGIDLDAGAESFAVRGGIVAALAIELGLGPDLVEPRPGPAWLQPATGRPVPMPQTSLLGIPARPLAADVIAAVGLPTAMRAQLDVYLKPVRLRDATRLGALVRARMGGGMVDKLVAPVVRGVHSMHPDDLELDRAAPGLRAALDRHGSLAAAVGEIRASQTPGSAVAGIRGGVHRLVTRLAAELEALGAAVRLGERVDDLGRLPGTVIAAAPGLIGPAAPGRRVVLATLVVEQSELDAAPRGSGLLVAEGAHGIRARALTHATAKWEWLRERAGDRHVLRLSYDDEPTDLAETARADAESLLGVPLPATSVVGFARAAWLRPAGVDVPDGVVIVGETVAGSGLAGIVSHANQQADRLLAD
jgi:oxygen-dependent protoporphyrinogen oxidase